VFPLGHLLLVEFWSKGAPATAPSRGGGCPRNEDSIILLCEGSIYSPDHKAPQSTKEAPNFGDLRLREVRTIPLDSRGPFSNSPSMLRLSGARRLSQQSHSCFPELRKGVYPRIYGHGGSLIHRSSWKVKSKESIPKLLCRAGLTPMSIPSAGAGATWESTESLVNFRQARAALTLGKGMGHPHGTFNAFAP
jgi:hypothetical protein